MNLSEHHPLPHHPCEDFLDGDAVQRRIGPRDRGHAVLVRDEALCLRSSAVHYGSGRANKCHWVFFRGRFSSSSHLSGCRPRLAWITRRFLEGGMGDRGGEKRGMCCQPVARRSSLLPREHPITHHLGLCFLVCWTDSISAVKPFGSAYLECDVSTAGRSRMEICRQMDAYVALSRSLSARFRVQG